MIFLAPAFLLAAAAAAAVVVALHFIVTGDAPVVALPTARFAPEQPVRARARAIRLQELLLMLLRLCLILALGAGLAQPVLRPFRRSLGRIVVADRSRAVANPAEVADSARPFLSAADA